MSFGSQNVPEPQVFLPPVLRTPKGRGIGFKRDPNKPMKNMRKVGKTKRGKEIKIFPCLRELIVQETAEALGLTKMTVGGWECDHIHGRDGDGFPLGRMLDPRNLQMIPEGIHQQKTNAPTKEGQRQDFRTKPVQERLIAVALRIEKKLGKVYSLKEFKKAVDSEIYQR